MKTASELRVRIFSSVLAGIVALSVCVPSATAKPKPVRTGIPPCRGTSGEGNFNMATLPGGSFPHCEYTGRDSRGWVTVEGMALSPFASIAVHVPAHPGRYDCVGDPNSDIRVTYVNAQALTFTARASDGKDTAHSGTCTVNVTMVTESDITGSVDATVVNGGEGDNPKPYRVFATWDVHNCLRGGCVHS